MGSLDHAQNRKRAAGAPAALRPWLRRLLLACAFLLPIFAYASTRPPEADNGYTAQRAADAIRLGPPKALAAAPDAIQGAPLDAPLETAPAPPSGATPSDADDVAALGTPQRVIPQESLDLLAESQAGTTGALGLARTKDGSHLKLTFRDLADYDYEVPEPKDVRAHTGDVPFSTGQIPEHVRKLDRQPVVISGFMVPLDIVHGGKVTSFILTENQMMCCFGIVPEVNEWAVIEMDGDGAKFYSDLPVAVYGTMEVGERFEDGYLTDIYRVTGTEVVEIRDFLKREGQAT